jgi:hypothetical protein
MATIRDTLPDDDARRMYDTLRALGGYKAANTYAAAVASLTIEQQLVAAHQTGVALFIANPQFYADEVRARARQLYPNDAEGLREAFVAGFLGERRRQPHRS